MVLKVKDNHENVTKGKGTGKWVFSRILPFVVFVLGVVFSFGAFFAGQSFVTAASDRDYDRITQEAPEVVRAEISALDLSLSRAAMFVGLSGDDRGALVSVASFERFHSVFWLDKPQDGPWGLSTLHDGGSERDFKLLLNQANVREGISEALQNSEQAILVMRLFDDRDKEEQGGEKQDRPKVLKTKSGHHVFAVTRAVVGDAGRVGVVIGFTDLEHVFGRSGFAFDAAIADLRIIDVQSGASLFSIARGLPDFQLYEKGGEYDVSFVGHVWAVTGRYAMQESMALLLFSPFAVLALLLFVTGIWSLYLRNNYRQAVRFIDMGEALALKTKALEGEIAKRRKLDRTARQIEQENRAVIDSVSDIIFEAAPNGEILFLNAQWSKITHFDIEQSMGQDFFKMLHPQDQDQIRDEFQALVDRKKHVFRVFTRLRTAQGTFRAVELSVSMVRENRDHEKRIVGTLTDVEERRRAERALSQAEKKYRNIVENAAGGIYQLTPEGLYLSANPAMARVLGYDTPEQILREVKNANESVYVDTAGREAFVTTLRELGSVNNHETQVKCRDGGVIWVNENIRSVTDEGGNILYFEGSMEDISDRKRANIALQDAKMHSDLANRAKSEFLANMSHELRTPLNSIIGFSEMIKGEVFGPIEKREYWDYARDIHESGCKLLDVINEILDISKIEAGERQLNEGLVDVEKCVYGCLDLLQGKIEGGEIIVTNNLSQVPNIIGEELAIKQVFMNLLSNAVKFTPHGGRITISSELDREGGLHLSITDTGIGLDDGEIKKALSPFGQVNSEHNREGSGTGLGLTLVDALLKLHGAELELVSQKGIGTSASAVFPADRVHLSGARVAERSEAEDTQEKA